MGLSQKELERLADDTYKNRIITTSVYCGQCGYNLRTLPYVYTCPECGNEYNARPLLMRGIFNPHEAQIPFGDLAALAACVVGGFVVLRGAFSPPDFGRIILGVALAALAIAFAGKAVREFGTLARSRTIARRIELEERE